MRSVRRNHTCKVRNWSVPSMLSWGNLTSMRPYNPAVGLVHNEKDLRGHLLTATAPFRQTSAQDWHLVSPCPYPSPLWQHTGKETSPAWSREFFISERLLSFLQHSFLLKVSHEKKYMVPPTSWLARGGLHTGYLQRAARLLPTRSSMSSLRTALDTGA